MARVSYYATPLLRSLVHRPQGVILVLTDVSDTIHADSLALFALNIEILLADVTKPEKAKILTLT